MVREMPRRQAGRPRIVLAHYPDQIMYLGHWQSDLYLAGHTHGGQICLPGSRPITKHDRLPRKMCVGLHRVGETWLHVTRGLGWTGIPLRTFAPAEMRTRWAPAARRGSTPQREER